MDRRHFLATSASPFLAGPLSLIGNNTLIAQGRDHITVHASGFTVNPPSNGKPWNVSINDILVGGITIPKFTAGWIGVNLASGVLSAVGGFLFNALLSALGIGGPNFEKLFKEQLEAIERIVRAAIKENEIRKDIAQVISIRQQMVEYMNVRKAKLLEDAKKDSLNVISDLASLGIDTYLHTLAAGSMRLAIFQECIKQDTNEKKNYRSFIDWLVDYHKRMDTEIDENTSPQELLKKRAKEKYEAKGKQPPTFAGLVDLSLFFEFLDFKIDKPILGVPARELPKISSDSTEATTIMINKYNDQVRLITPNALHPRPNLLDPRKPLKEQWQNFNPVIWGRAKYEVEEALTTPQDSLEYYYVNWKSFRKQLKEKTIVIGEEIVKKWKASIKVVAA